MICLKHQGAYGVQTQFQINYMYIHLILENMTTFCCKLFQKEASGFKLHKLEGGGGRSNLCKGEGITYQFALIKPQRRQSNESMK